MTPFPYEIVIGLEVHVQLNTDSKAFCSDPTAFGALPNTQVSAISLAHPGTLPRANEVHVRSAVRLGLALGGEVNHRSTFDRKHYFYPDLPKGYQITQDDAPIVRGGELPIRMKDGSLRCVAIHHIHMEEDAGKSLHEVIPGQSLIDLNRAGVPLLEVVTQPDLRSAVEVDALMSSMRRLVRWLGISDGNMEQGSLRCDCNISLRPWGAAAFGERCEVKNLNSMRYARQAIAYEVERQRKILDAGGQVQRQTLLFDPERGTTRPMRSKESATDYRYFPEPDLPPVRLEAKWVEDQQRALPELPEALYQRLQEQLDLPAYASNLLSEDRETAAYFLELLTRTALAKPIANFLINQVLPWCKGQGGVSPAHYPLSKSQILNLLQLIEEGSVSHSAAMQKLLPALLEAPERKPSDLADELGLFQTRAEADILPIIRDLLEAHPEKVVAYQKGKTGLLGFFMGQLMKRTHGKADPQRANALLREQLEAQA